jgi:hypothetical protein
VTIKKGSINPASNWPGQDSTPSHTSCPIPMPTSKPQSLHPEYGGNLNMEATRFSKTFIYYHITMWHHNPEDYILILHCHENLKSHI